MATTNLTNRLKTPGVYIEEIAKLPPSIAQVETAIPAFIGYTQTAVDSRNLPLLLKPYRITSLIEYERYFGLPDVEKNIVVTISGSDVNADILPTPSSKFRMYYAVQLFFANGGGPCWIVSTGNYTDSGGQIVRPDLEAGLAITEKIDEITLYVFPDAQGLTTAVDYYGLYTNAIAMCTKLQDRFTVTDVWQDPQLPPDQWHTNIDTLRNTLSGDVDTLKYAASYYPNLRTTLEIFYDGPAQGGLGQGDGNVKVKLNGQDTDLASLKNTSNALYFQARSAIDDIPLIMPPSPAMVGIYARVDAARGVWKAPANESVNAVQEPDVQVTDSGQEDLNIDVQAGKSINVVRFFTGRGILVWGARTLAGNDNEWRYVPVRRFFNMVEESTKNSTKQFVFEPNDRNTWTRVRSMIENFLTLQWKAGALMGTTTEEAYYVRVGLNETMTELDLWEGRMIVEIGMAVVRPAEFIILQFSHKMLAES
jgi:phage tail sheath protein FI